MALGELYIPPEINGRNPITGRFLKGHVPPNKGKKWDEYLTEEQQERARIGWSNLSKYRHVSTIGCGCGRPHRKVVALDAKGRMSIYESIAEACRVHNCNETNIRRCCRENEQHKVGIRGKENTDRMYYGLRWYYESDKQWEQKLHEEISIYKNQ